MSIDLTRRRFLIGSGVAATGILTGCDALVQSPSVNAVLEKGEWLYHDRATPVAGQSAIGTRIYRG